MKPRSKNIGKGIFPLKVGLTREVREMLKTLAEERQMTATDWIRENIEGAYRFREQLREAWESAENQCVMHDEREKRCAQRRDHTTHHEDQNHEWMLDGVLYLNGQPKKQSKPRHKFDIKLGGGSWEVWCEKCRKTKSWLRAHPGEVQCQHHFTYGISPEALARARKK